MAEETEQEARTEQASPRRLDAAWESGDIPVARDVVSVATLCAAMAGVITLAPGVRDALMALVSHAMSTADVAAPADLRPYFWSLMFIGLKICGGAALAGLLAAVAQTRGGFWPDRAIPDVSRLVRLDRVLRIFKVDGIVDIGLSALKLALVGAAFWLSIRHELPTFRGLFDVPVPELLAQAVAPLQRALLAALLTLMLLAALDFFVQKRRFDKRMRMTREEMKREQREEDGDPIFRSRRRRRHRQLSKARVLTEVPRADAIVVNPTHIAVAIRYRRDEGGAPRVIAKGKGQLAEIIRDLARSHGIPIIEDIPLARLLYRRVKIGGKIPAETYKAVAAILAFVYRVTGLRPGASRR